MNTLEQPGIDLDFGFVSDDVDVSDVDQEDTDIETSSDNNEPVDTSEKPRAMVIAEFVMSHDHFGLDVTQSGITEWLVDTLKAIEESKCQFASDFDITKVNVKALDELVHKWRARYEELAIKTEALRREELLQAYMIAFEGRPVTEVFSALASNEAIAEAIQLKAAAYAQMISPENVKNKTDRNAITEKINQYTLTNAPAPYWFVLSELMTDDNLSEKTKTAIAKEFSLDPHTISGAALSAALSERDENDQLLYAGETKLALGGVAGDGIAAITNETGQTVIHIDHDGETIELTFDERDSPHDIGLVASILKIWQVIGDDTFFGTEINPHSAIMRGANRIDLYRMQRIIEAATGGHGRYSGEILTDDLVNDLVALNSFVNSGHNADELNIFAGDTHYAVNVERLAAISLYLRTQSDPQNFNLEAIQDHLALVCPVDESVNEEPADLDVGVEAAA